MDKNIHTSKLKTLYHRLPLPAWIAIGVILIIGISYALIFGISKKVAFSYAGETCVKHLTLGANAQQSSDSGYVVEIKGFIKVGNATLAGTTLCFTPIDTPTVGTETVHISPYGNWFASKQFSIEVPEAPVANATTLTDAALPTTRPLEIPLSAHDTVFDYVLLAGEKSAGCDAKDAAIHCDVPALELDQGETYDVALERHFKDEKVATLASGSVETLLPLKQKSASLKDNQTVYNKPKEFIFEYDKAMLKGGATLQAVKDDTKEGVPVTVTTKENSLVIGISEELPRKTEYVLTIDHAEAVDGSALDGKSVIDFKTSGGPKVKSVNIGGSGVARSGTIVITLDQEIENTAKIKDLVSIQGMSASVAKSGKTLQITYSNAPFCGSFTISVKKGLESKYDIVSDENWSHKSRTICHTTRTIGYSTQGRAINAYTYGTGSKTMLYVGSLHGNEHSSRYLMNAWMAELEANPGSIPSGTRIIVIPSANPDGVAMNSRYNARNVDLNRNFNVSDWKKDIQTVTGQPMKGGGGKAPESEAETKALVKFSREVTPHLTMSYHAAAAYAIGNTCGNSGSLAAKYASITGYRNMTGVSGAFSYEITGTFDDWLCEKQGRTSVLIELATSSDAEFARNKAALWAMARS